MPNFHSNSPSPVLRSEILRTGRLSSSLVSFYKKASALIMRTEKKRENRRILIKQIIKVYEDHQLVFHEYDISNRYI